MDGTAKMGKDYLGETPRKIVWESGEDGEKCVMFTTSPEVASLKSFTVKISEIFGNGQVSPAAGTKTVSVVIDPGKPAPEYDETALGSAVGSFRGVLREQTGAGTENRVLSGIGVLVSESGISATLSVAGSEVVFSGDGFDSESGVYAKATLSRVHVIDGVEYEDTLVLDILKKPLASYEVEGFPWFEGTATANIFIPNADGITADEYIYTGDIHRDNTALPLYATSIAPFAGKYTVAFVPEVLPQETEPKGLSTLTLTVAADGTVSGTGVLADGVEVAVSSKASISGSLAAPDDDSDDMLFDFYGLVIPVYCGTETMAFGGDLNIFHNGGKPAVFCSGEEWEYFREGRSDVSSTEFGESGYTFIAMPIGGIYDGTVNRAYLAIGKDYAVDSGEWPLVDTNDMSCAGLTTNANGIVTGTITLASGSYQVNGVEIMNRDPDLPATFGNISIAGRIAVPTNVGDGRTWMDSYPFYVREIDEDPDWTEDFGLSATITFNGNGNTGGYAPTAITAQVKSAEFIPEVDTNSFRRAGYEFVCWRDEGGADYVAGDEFLVPVSNTTLTAVWTFSVGGVPEALDCVENTNLVFVAGGEAPWIPQTAVRHDSPSAIRSGVIGTGGGTSWIETKVTGSGRLSFWYKCETFQGMDKLTVTIDGAEAGTYSGTVDWTKFEHEIASGGTHTVRWTYSRTTSWDTGIANCAWVDELQFGPTVTVTFDPTVGTMTDERTVRKVVGTAFGALPRPESATMTFDYWRDDDGARYSAATVVPDHDVALTAEWKDKEWEVRFEGGAADSGNPPEVQTGLPGAEIVLPGPGTLAKSGYEFVGWSDGTTIRTNGATYVVGAADVTMTAQWSLSVNGVGEALGNTELTYSAGGDAAWYAQSDVVLPSGSDAQAVRSGAINAAGTTWLEAQVSGTGLLSFWYRCSTLANIDSFTVSVDGEVVGTYSGTVDWTKFEHEFASGGTHTIKWTYSRASYSWEDASVQNCAWVDELQFGPTVTVTFDPAGGTVAEATRTFLIGSMFRNLPVPDLADAEFLGWTLGGSPVEEGVTEVPATDSTLVAQWRYADRRVSFAAGEGTGSAPDPVFGQPFTDVELPAQGMLVAPAGHVFAGWSDGAVLYVPGGRYGIGTSNVTLTAQWSYAVTGYAGALDSDAPVYTAGGNSAWYVDSAVYDASVPGNASSLRSGAVPFSSGVTWCQAQVSGAGSLSFRWKISALSYGNCHFRVTVDGAEVLSQDGGVTDWQESEAVRLGDGVHVVRWTYSTDWGWDDASVQNCAWIDTLVWTPDVQPGTKAAVIAAVTEPAAGMTLEETRQAVSDQIDLVIASGATESEAVAWIEDNKFTGAEIATAKAIDVSYGIGADTLFENEPAGVICAMVPAESPAGYGAAFEVAFQLRDGLKGNAVTVAATEAAKAYVATLVKATTDIGDWTKAPDNLVETTYDEETETVSVKVSLRSIYTSAFIKVGN